MNQENKKSIFEPVDNNAGTANVKMTTKEEGQANDLKNLNEIIRAGIEQKHLESLAKSFVKDKHENYLIARSIVIDVHLSLEFYMNWIIRILLNYGAQRVKIAFLSSNNLGDAIQKIEYRRKLSLINIFGIFTPNSLSIFDKVNYLRNAFAHGDKIESPRYNYNNSSIFEHKTIDILVNDQKKVLHEFSAFLVKAGMLKEK